MTTRELERLAYMGAEMPAGLRQPEQMYFLSMRSLYREYRKKAVSEEQSRREKAELLRAWELAVYKYAHAEKTAALWMRIDLAAAEYIKRPCLETADEFYRTVYNLPEQHRKVPIEASSEAGKWEYAGTPPKEA